MRTTPSFNNFDLYIGPGRDAIYPLIVPDAHAGEMMKPIEQAIDCHGHVFQNWLAGLQRRQIAHADLLVLG